MATNIIPAPSPMDSLLQRLEKAFANTGLLEHFLQEPAVEAKKAGRKTFLVRPGGSNHTVRIGHFILLGCQVVFAVAFGESTVFFVRACKKDGTWTSSQQSTEANRLLAQLIQELQPGSKSRVSAQDVFAMNVDTGGWTSEVCLSGACCHKCKAKQSSGPWRYGQTFERLCSRCWKAEIRANKNVLGDGDENEEEEVGNENADEDEDKDEQEEEDEDEDVDVIISLSMRKIKSLCRRFHCSKCCAKVQAKFDGSNHIMVSSLSYILFVRHKGG